MAAVARDCDGDDLVFCVAPHCGRRFYCSRKSRPIWTEAKSSLGVHTGVLGFAVVLQHFGRDVNG
jgi:hypothetical protein